VELTLEAIEKKLRGMAPEKRAELVEKVKPQLSRAWLPQPGPQMEAFRSQADELLYGGAAGGGKTDLLIGLATTQHQASTLFRRQSTDLDTLWERLTEVAGKTGIAQTNSVKKNMRLNDGRRIYGGHLDAPGSEKGHQGNARDFYGFDEGAQLDEFKVNFVTQWLRAIDPKQRKRVVIATNPPMPEMKDGQLTDVPVGDWLLRWFAPWLDDTFPDPAAQGELRWCYMKRAGDRLNSIWVEGPGHYDLVTGEKVANVSEADLDAGRVAVARSRTFIRSLAKDNAFLRGTGYIERLAGQPEPFRSMLLTGDFTIKGEDHPMQVIPTAWVVAAQARWREREAERRRLRQLVLAGDIAQGGADTTVLAPLLETDFFDELVVRPGRDTPNGESVAALVLGARKDNAYLVLDGTGSWADSTALVLYRDHRIDADLVIASATTGEWTPTMTYKYGNIRAQMWWGFREALDPKSDYEICLPPSSRLRAQLTAPVWGPKGKIMYVESKEELRKRLGSSTDEADAVLLAWLRRDTALSMRNKSTQSVLDRIIHGEDYAAKQSEPFEFDDPLKGW
jgi:hypothetical protein